MVYMPEMEGLCRFETAPPVEDRFFLGAYDCDVTTRVGIFVPDGSKMSLEGRPSTKSGRPHPDCRVHEWRHLRARARHGACQGPPPAWTNTAKARSITDVSGSATASPRAQKHRKRQISDTPDRSARDWAAS